MNASIGQPIASNGYKTLLIIFVLIMVMMVMLGGKAFDQVVESNHFYDKTHACDEEAKKAALAAGTWWSWNYQCRDNEGTKYTVEVKTPLGPVILIVVIGSIGGLVTLTLVTGYRKNSNLHN
jgi:hypothetical protein